jgi:small subunit ribosomal protein S19
MSRSKWKTPFINLNLFKSKKRAEQNNQIVDRYYKIIPNYLGRRFMVHNGKNLIEILITENMIGHKFGEFAFTRAKYIFKSKKLKKKLKKLKKKT